MNDMNRRVLFVDDEVNLLEGLRRQLRRKYEVATASSGPAGLEALESQGPFAVVVSDYNMPGMNGAEFLEEVHRRVPQTVAVMLTGRPELSVAVSALHQGHIFRFLQKPCTQELLEQALDDAIEQYRLVSAERTLTAELNAKNEELRLLNEQLEARVVQRTALIQRMQRFMTDLNGIDSLEGVADLVVATTADMLASRRVSLMLPEGNREYLRIAAAVGIAEEVKEAIRVPVGGAIAGRVFAESQNIVVSEPDEMSEFGDRYDSEFFASIPLASTSLVTPSGPVGVLNVSEPLDGRPYSTEALAQLRAIGEVVAIALCNQIRLRERNEARDATILALARLAENRDPETGTHLERVQTYCQLLSQVLVRRPEYARVITRSFIETIVRSSPLHDIGKVGIPDEILLKPGRLSPTEFEIMKRHAQIGGDTIRSIINQGRTQDFLQMGMEIAYYHHEKFNGKGYPFGLAGEQIPLSARIVAVADVYDALTSKRVYKPAMPHGEAVAILREEAGSHFAPEVVDAFFSREQEFAQLAVSLADLPEAQRAEPLSGETPGLHGAAGGEEGVSYAFARR
ncbi:MAG TPA: response regulator [Phycisphaerae bacterium]|nr:response regulator [Phycisphaerae bacterium]HRY70410.1 response regulator [Phycisphaerae bacterium]HSA28127.1 response regulator [Phycisphaerae bacterium]